MINYQMLSCVVSLMVGYIVAKYTGPHIIFDSKRKEGYVTFKNKRLYFTRARVGFGADVFLNDEIQTTNFGYVFGLPNSAQKHSTLKIQKLLGESIYHVKEKESFIEKLTARKTV